MRHKRVNISPRQRFAIFHRDGFRCCYCGQHAGQSELVIDHVVPVSRGGTNHPTNLKTACLGCNAGKSDVFEITEIPGGNYPYSDYAALVVETVGKAFDRYLQVGEDSLHEAVEAAQPLPDMEAEIGEW